MQRRLGIEVDDEPSIDKFEAVKNFRNLADKMEGQRGLTVLTMCKGLTFNQLVNVAAKEGTGIYFFGQGIEQELGNKPVVKTYIIEIANGPFIDGKKIDRDERRDCIRQHECEEPTALELAALCIFTKKIFKESLFFAVFAQSSTRVQYITLAVRCFYPLRLDVCSLAFCNPDITSAVGMRKLG